MFFTVVTCHNNGTTSFDWDRLKECPFLLELGESVFSDLSLVGRWKLGYRECKVSFTPNVDY